MGFSQAIRLIDTLKKLLFYSILFYISCQKFYCLIGGPICFPMLIRGRDLQKFCLDAYLVRCWQKWSQLSCFNFHFMSCTGITGWNSKRAGLKWRMPLSWKVVNTAINLSPPLCNMYEVKNFGGSFVLHVRIWCRHVKMTDLILNKVFDL